MRNYCAYLFAPLVFFILSSSAAKAERYESQTLFSNKAWEVELTHDTSDGGLWCSAITRNRQGQSFDVTAFASGGLGIFVFDGNWDLAPRDVRFIIDIDYSRWEIDGRADGSGVSVSQEPGPKVGKFIGELADGSAVAIYNRDLRKLGTFSLAGSSASLLKLSECWDAIKQRASDPFGASIDPFD